MCTQNKYTKVVPLPTPRPARPRSAPRPGSQPYVSPESSFPSRQPSAQRARPGFVALVGGRSLPPTPGARYPAGPASVAGSSEAGEKREYGRVPAWRTLGLARQAGSSKWRSVDVSTAAVMEGLRPPPDVRLPTPEDAATAESSEARLVDVGDSSNESTLRSGSPSAAAAIAAAAAAAAAAPTRAPLALLTAPSPEQRAAAASPQAAAGVSPRAASAAPEPRRARSSRF